MTTVTERAEYLSCAESAKLLRKALKAEWPHVKFSVRSSLITIDGLGGIYRCFECPDEYTEHDCGGLKYAGGASIDVHWEDGPSQAEVETVSDQFASARFDGMIDYQTSAYHWLMPDGTVELARIIGTESSRGTIPDYQSDGRPHPDAKPVHLGSHYVSASRSRTDYETAKAAALGWIFDNCAVDGLGINARFGNRWVHDLANSVVYGQREDENLINACSRVVLRYGRDEPASLFPLNPKQRAWADRTDELEEEIFMTDPRCICGGPLITIDGLGGIYRCFECPDEYTECPNLDGLFEPGDPHNCGIPCNGGYVAREVVGA